ncbi:MULTISPECIES: lipopolysaccharide assembly protein LapB [Gammaproteobacteria]|uniref:tetratricopeptide repeat protein n=1 Tax=Gammaproteobacteria TaxID=1236 RepID=UPI001403F443|nr:MULTISPECIES: tetratricopeptide repeat protein [Gammaproteobacteria]
MSLINQMLKDIDQRGSEHKQAGHVSSKYVPSNRPRSSWFYALVGVASSVVIVLLVLWMFKPEQTTSEQPQMTESQPQQSERQAQPAAVTPARTTSANHAQPVPMAINQEAAQSEPETASQNSPQAETQPQIDIADVEVQESPASEQEASEKPQGDMQISNSTASPREIAQRYYNQGLQLLSEGQQRQGAARLQDALLLAPEFHDAREELAIYYFSRGFLSDALLVLERGLERFPNQPRLLLLQARILERSGQEQVALELLRDVPARFPQHADLLSLRGVLAEQLQDYELAIGTYETLLNWRTDQGTWWLGLALSYDALDQIEQAKQAYRSALSDPTLAQVSRDYIQQRLEALQ